MNSLEEWSGSGFTVTWPGRIATFRALTGFLGQTNPMWGVLTQLAKREKNVKWSDFVVQVGISTSGPAALKFGVRSNSFTAAGGLTAGPVDLNQLGGDLKSILSEAGVDISVLQSGNIPAILGQLQ